MKLQRTALATALAAVLGLGMAGQASADVYAGSSLTIQNLLIQFQNAAGASANDNVDIRSFNFSLTNTALINGVGTVNGATCGGTIGAPPANDCGVNPTLDALAANAPGSAFDRTNNQTSGADSTFTWFKVGGGNWSNSDSVIYTSELTSAGANPTHTDQIAESNITTANSASASSEIQSVTGFTLNFSVAGPNPVNMLLSFLADPDMRAEILNDLGIAFGAQANMAVTMTLQKDGTGGIGQPPAQGAFWAPGGDATNDCSVGGTVTCSETADSQDLNLSIGTSTNDTFAVHSYDPNVAGLTSFGMTAGGLSEGNWTLTLRAQTSTNLTRREAIPEPSSLALVGLAMLGVGASLRRRKA